MSHKLPKVNETIKSIIGREIQKEFGLTHGLVSITKVSTSPDLKQARIFVSCFQSPDCEKFIGILNSRAGEYQHTLSHQVKMKFTPRLNFIIDDTIEYADRIERLLKK